MRMIGLASRAIVLTALSFVTGCSKPEYDASTPEAALGSMYAMIHDGRPEMLSDMVYIEPRSITYDDGVTEASAIDNVTEKTGQMLGRLFRVAGKLREKFPAAVEQELAQAGPSFKMDDAGFNPSRFLADPFGLLDEQRSRVNVEDLGDGTAAILIDGKPAFGFGLQMKEIDGSWKIDVPIDLLQQWRPDTRYEWSVLASMMLAIENALKAFEKELDEARFQNLEHASRRAGWLLGERVFVQVMIYRGMKKNGGDPRSAVSDRQASQ